MLLLQESQVLCVTLTLTVLCSGSSPSSLPPLKLVLQRVAGPLQSAIVFETEKVFFFFFLRNEKNWCYCHCFGRLSEHSDAEDALLLACGAYSVVISATAHFHFQDVQSPLCTAKASAVHIPNLSYATEV